LVRIALAVVKGAAVEAVGSRLGLRRHDRGDSLAQLRVKILGGDLGFGNSVERRVDDDDAEDRVLIVRSIQHEGDATERLAVDLDLLAGLRIFIRRVAPAQLLGAGQ